MTVCGNYNNESVELVFSQIFFQCKAWHQCRTVCPGCWFPRAGAAFPSPSPRHLVPCLASHGLWVWHLPLRLLKAGQITGREGRAVITAKTSTIAQGISDTGLNDTFTSDIDFLNSCKLGGCGWGFGERLPPFQFCRKPMNVWLSDFTEGKKCVPMSFYLPCTLTFDNLFCPHQLDFENQVFCNNSNGDNYLQAPSCKLNVCFFRYLFPDVGCPR